MQLAALQAALGTVLLRPEGLKVLESDSAWEAFLQTEAGRPLVGFPREKLYLYEELLFASVEDTLRSFFPVTRRFFKSQWYDWVEQYRRQHPNPSFQLYQVASGFPAFLATQTETVAKYPFLLDLARYEWLEIEVLNAPNTERPEGFEPAVPDTVDELADWCPVPNQARRFARFDYNVPGILEALNDIDEDSDTEQEALDTLAPEPTPCEILMYRDLDTHHARFFVLTPLTATLLQALTPDRTYLNTLAILQETEPSLQAVPFDTLLKQALALIQHCHTQHMFHGSAPAPSA